MDGQMSDPAKNKSLVILGTITALGTICIQLIQVGSLTGRVETVIDVHERRIGGIEDDVKAQGKSISEIEGRLHGIASQVGKVPGRVAARLENDNTNPSKP